MLLVGFSPTAFNRSLGPLLPGRLGFRLFSLLRIFDRSIQSLDGGFDLPPLGLSELRPLLDGKSRVRSGLGFAEMATSEWGCSG